MHQDISTILAASNTLLTMYRGVQSSAVLQNVLATADLASVAEPLFHAKPVHSV